MDFQLVSDLHLEFTGQHFYGDTGLQPSPRAKALVLAGDIGNGAMVIDHFHAWPVPCIFVPGNHDFYGQDFDEYIPYLKERAAGTSVVVLDKDEVVLNGVRFLGAALWTDYALSEPVVPSAMAMLYARSSMYDFKNIRRGGRLLAPLDLWERNRDSVQWLESVLATPHAGPTVVVTHHAPHPLSVHPKFAHETRLNASFASNLERLMGRVDLWAHGHVHDSFDYTVARCRIRTNPRGYPLQMRHAQKLADSQFENSSFNRDLVVSV